MKARAGFSSLLFRKTLSETRGIFDPSRSLLVFDRRLTKLSPEFREWSARFPFRYPVASGEKLKSLERFPHHAKRMARIAGLLAPREMTVVAVGGGSVGDFAGFFASTFKRGVKLIHVPSTWLAAIDSSHGGKTGLNSDGVKNQFGTFYPAQKVVLVRSLLGLQGRRQIEDAKGELAKIALLDGGRLANQLIKFARFARTARTGRDDEDLMWTFLKPAIFAKLKIVERDPIEAKGHRQVLNLGHTLGHVLESARSWSHGMAVAQGLFFAVEYSQAKEFLSEADAKNSLDLLTGSLGLSRRRGGSRISRSRFTRLLLQDKKRSGDKSVTFVFLRGPGRPERHPVPAREIVAEARRQGWVS